MKVKAISVSDFISYRRPNIEKVDIEINESSIDKFACYMCVLAGEENLMHRYINGQVSSAEVFNHIHQTYDWIHLSTTERYTTTMSTKDKNIIKEFKYKCQSYLEYDELSDETKKIIKKVKLTRDMKISKVINELIVQYSKFKGFVKDLNNNYETVFQNCLSGYTYPRADEDTINAAYIDFKRDYLTHRPAKLSKQQLTVLFIYYAFLRHGVEVDSAIFRIPMASTVLKRILDSLKLKTESLYYLKV